MHPPKFFNSMINNLQKSKLTKIRFLKLFIEMCAHTSVTLHINIPFKIKILFKSL